MQKQIQREKDLEFYTQAQEAYKQSKAQETEAKNQVKDNATRMAELLRAKQSQKRKDKHLEML